MKDWIVKLNAFLQLNDRDILKNTGSVSHELVKQSAELEYDKYKKQQQKASSKFISCIWRDKPEAPFLA
ncbi:RhuM family protein [Candidatus Acidulodesulfobacterium sp. H_13]|uniref:RhuM family protein n=1 Tax=Candidatus Acidulodesulfobacterium sp. H_13 TaxID=3395470 RepID=UPI003AF8C0F4